VGLIRRVIDRLRPRRDRFNLRIEPHYAIKASRGDPYFQKLEDQAREGGYLGAFVVDETGRLRPGRKERLETRSGLLTLDAYPNPAAIEGRTVGDYDDPYQALPTSVRRPSAGLVPASAPRAESAQARRRQPRATVLLEDDTEVFLRRTAGGLVLEEPAPRFRR
jgi:hypothetical protein